MSANTELTTTVADATAAAQAALDAIFGLSEAAELHAAAVGTEQALVDVNENPAPVKKLTAAQKARAKAAKIEADAKAKAAKIVADAKAKTAADAAKKKAAAAARKDAAKAERPAPKAALVFESIEAALEPLAAAIAPLDHDKGKITATVAGRKIELRWTRPEVDGENYSATNCRLNVREFTGEEGAAIGLNGKIKSGSYVAADRAGLLSGLRAGFHKNAERLAAQGRTELAKELDALAA